MLTYAEAARRRRKWSLRKECEILDAQRKPGEPRTHPPYLSMIETGKGIPTPELRKRMSDLLNVPEEMLLKPVPMPLDVPITDDDAQPATRVAASQPDEPAPRVAAAVAGESRE